VRQYCKNPYYECYTKLLIVRILYRYQPKVDSIKSVDDYVSQHQTSSVVFYLNVGLHHNLDFEVTRTVYLDPLFELVSRLPPNGRHVHILLSTLPYPSPLKDIKKFPGQSRACVRRYNQLLRDYHRNHSLISTLVDYAPLSDGSPSYDGTHYDQKTNLILANLVINTLAGLHYAYETRSLLKPRNTD